MMTFGYMSFDQWLSTEKLLFTESDISSSDTLNNHSVTTCFMQFDTISLSFDQQNLY